MGIEPTSSAWKAEVLPLNYTRASCLPVRPPSEFILVEGGGFEPPKAEPSDLQSDPFGRSGTPPNVSRALCGKNPYHVNQFRGQNPRLSSLFLHLAANQVDCRTGHEPGDLLAGQAVACLKILHAAVGVLQLYLHGFSRGKPVECDKTQAILP